MNSQFYGNRLHENQEKRRKDKQQPKSKPLGLNINTQKSKYSPRSKQKDTPSPLTSKSPGLKISNLDSPRRRGNSNSPNRGKGRSPFKNNDSVSIDLATNYNTASPNTKHQMNQLQMAFNEKMKIQIERQLNNQPQNRKLKISTDDPFTNIFINDMQYAHKGTKAMREEFERAQQKERDELEQQRGIKPDFDSDDGFGQKQQEAESDAVSSVGEKEDPSTWQNEQFYSLPENVQNAINTAKLKKKHSDFYYRLRLLNDKIHVFTTIFYNRVPVYQKKFYEKKKKDLELKLKRQKEEFEEQMLILEKKMNKRNVSNNNVYESKFGQQRASLGLNSNPQHSEVSSHQKRMQLMRKDMFKKRSVSSNEVLNLKRRNFSLNAPKPVNEKDKESDDSNTLSPSSAQGQRYKHKTPNVKMGQDISLQLNKVKFKKRSTLNLDKQEKLQDKQRNKSVVVNQKAENLKAEMNNVEAIVEGDQKEEHSSFESFSELCPSPSKQKERQSPPREDSPFKSNQNKTKTHDQSNRFVKDRSPGIPTVKTITQNSSLSISEPTPSRHQSHRDKRTSPRASANQQMEMETNEKKFQSIPASNNISKSSIIRDKTIEATKSKKRSSDSQNPENCNQNINNSQQITQSKQDVLKEDSKIIQEAINEINYGVAELRDIRMSITQKAEDAMSNMELVQVTSFDNTPEGHVLPPKQFNTMDVSNMNEDPSPTFAKSKDLDRKKQIKTKRKSKKLSNQYELESPYNPSIQQLNQKQRDEVQKIKSELISKQKKLENKQSFAIKDMASGQFIQNISEEKDIKDIDLFEMEKTPIIMQMNSRPIYNSKEIINGEYEELQLKVEQTSVTKQPQQVKKGLEVEDGTQITMRNLMKKKDTDQIKEQSDIKEENNERIKIEDEIMSASSISETVPVFAKKEVYNQKIPSDNKQQPVMKEAAQYSGTSEFVGSQISQPLSNMNMYSQRPLSDQSQTNKVFIDDKNALTIQDNPNVTSKNDQTSQNDSSRERRQQNTVMTQNDFILQTNENNDLNTEELTNSARVIEKTKHKSSMTTTGKSGKRQDLKDNSFNYTKDHKFIQLKNSQREKNKNVNNSIEDTDENSSIVASGARSPKSRADNFTAPLTQTMPTTQQGRRSKKFKSRQSKHPLSNNAYLYQIETQIRSLNQKNPNGRNKAYFKNSKKVQNSSPRTAAYQLIHLPNVRHTRGGSSLVKTENFDQKQFQNKQSNYKALNFDYYLNGQVDEIDAIENQNVNDTYSEVKIVSGLQIFNSNDVKLPSTTTNKNRRNMVEKQNAQKRLESIQMSTKEPSSLKSARGKFRVKNQAKTLLEKFNLFNSIANKRNDHLFIGSLHSGSVLTQKNRASPQLQTSHFFDKRKLTNRIKKEISKTPMNQGQNNEKSQMEALLIDESGSRTQSRNIKVLPQNDSTSEALQNSYECKQINIDTQKDYKKGIQNITMPIGGYQTGVTSNVENTADNAASNEHILDVTEDGNSNANKRSTVVDSKRHQDCQKNSQISRIQQTLSGSSIDDSIYQNLPGGQYLNKRPLTQLIKDRQNLNSQGSSQKWRDSQKYSDLLHKNATNTREMEEIKEIHTYGQINQKIVKTISKQSQQPNQTLDKVQAYKKYNEIKQRKLSIQQGNNIIQGQPSNSKEKYNNLINISNEFSLQQFNQAQKTANNQAQKKNKLIDFVGPLGTHIRPSKDIKQKFHSPLNLNQRRLQTSLSQSPRSLNPEKTAITQFQADRQKRPGADYNIYDVFKPAQMPVKIINSNKQSASKFLQQSNTKYQQKRDQGNFRQSHSSQNKPQFDAENYDSSNSHAVSEAPLMNQMGSNHAFDLNTIVQPNLIEITPRKKSQLKNTAMISGKNNNDLRLPQLQNQNKKFI